MKAFTEKRMLWHLLILHRLVTVRGVRTFTGWSRHKTRNKLEWMVKKGVLEKNSAGMGVPSVYFLKDVLP